MRRGIGRVTPEAREILLTAFWQALCDAFEHRLRESGGDFRPDPKSERFPEWRPPGVSPKPAGNVSLTGLVEEWWTEAKAANRKESTYESYRNTMASLVAFLGHDDATRVTRENIVAFKDHRLASLNPRTGKSLSPKTVRDSDLAGLKSVFGWAITNSKMPGPNPADGVKVMKTKKRRVRSKGFTDAEAVVILKAALKLRRGDERIHGRTCWRDGAATQRGCATCW